MHAMQFSLGTCNYAPLVQQSGVTIQGILQVTTHFVGRFGHLLLCRLDFYILVSD